MEVMPECVFCGATGRMSAEHVFPDWSQPFLRSEDGLGTHTRTIMRAEGETTSEHRGLPATSTVRSVCGACNNVWMSRLEGDAKPYLETMLNNHGRTYYRGGQALLATWAVKTALVAGSKFEPQTPEVFYRNLTAARTPSGTTRIWMGATPWAEFHYVDHRPLKISRRDEPRVRTENAFAGLLALGHVVFYVVSWIDNPPSVEPVQRYSDSLLELWPYSGPKAWPPRGLRLDEDALDDLAETFGRVPTP
jgi:hypothetical protein